MSPHTLPSPVPELIILAIVIPTAMLLLFRVWPLLRGRPPVRWPYTAPFVTLMAAVGFIALVTYVGPLFFWEHRHDLKFALLGLIAAEIVVVFVTIHLLPEAETNFISEFFAKRTRMLRRYSDTPVLVCPKCGRNIIDEDGKLAADPVELRTDGCDCPACVK